MTFQSLEEKFGNERVTSDHTDLSTKDAYNKVNKLVTWFKTTQLTESDAKKLVSFSTGEICCYENFNTDEAMAVHLITSKVPLRKGVETLMH